MSAAKRRGTAGAAHEASRTTAFVRRAIRARQTKGVPMERLPAASKQGALQE